MSLKFCIIMLRFFGTEYKANTHKWKQQNITRLIILCAIDTHLKLTTDVQILDTLLATSLMPSSFLLQHDATIGKNRDKNVIAAPYYLFYTQ